MRSLSTLALHRDGDYKLARVIAQLPIIDSQFDCTRPCVWDRRSHAHGKRLTIADATQKSRVCHAADVLRLVGILRAAGLEASRCVELAARPR